MYSVYQHWDPLKVCMVGKSYSPEFYSFITNSRVRTVMERIAQETEEDYQSLVNLLESFGVKVLRPDVTDNYKDYLTNGKIMPPPMTPRDYTAMIGKTFYIDSIDVESIWNQVRGESWPVQIPNGVDELTNCTDFVKQEISVFLSDTKKFIWQNTLNYITNPKVYGKGINTAMTTRIGRDLYFGTDSYSEDLEKRKQHFVDLFPEYRCHVINTGGHADGTFCPVVPGLIVSLNDVPNYAETFPGWEVVYLPGQSWSKVEPFLKLKEVNRGKWWVPGEELNDEFTDFVESWLGHWTGYVEETVFDVNMLVVDEKNVICNNYNKEVFGVFERYGITPHVLNFRHRYFWDGGLHCITSDIHREGTMKDYFPQRG
jgi:hypothetical protein